MIKMENKFGNTKVIIMITKLIQLINYFFGQVSLHLRRFGDFYYLLIFLLYRFFGY
jgi:hypothetical protein